MFKKIFSNPFFLFPALTCIFFWPLSLQIFTFKNDALTYYYPIRTLISDALNNYELPLWTPFINMGYPLHADMQSGAWNPLVWIIGFITNYSLAAFHYELLLYLSMAGIGFYYLCREYGWNKYTAIIVGFAYEFSGPVIDSMQFTTCISSACYIPFIFLFFRRLLKDKQPANNALLTALFLYLLFTGGYPAFFIITLYLILAFLLFSFFSSGGKTEFVKRLILPLGLLSLVFLLLSLPAIISFVNHLQFIDRGKKQGLDFVLENSMPPSCMFSLISPFSTTSTTPFFNTNILMRNVYMGIVPLAFLIYAAVNKELRNIKEIRFFIITAFVLFGMAWGSYFFLRQAAYYTLPLMNTFRHPALFRFFGVIFFLLTAGFAINGWDKKRNGDGSLKIITLSIGIIVLLIFAIILLSPGSKLIPSNFYGSQPKNLIPLLGFQQRFLVQLPFIIAIAGFLYLIVALKKGPFYLLLLSLADLFFATQLNTPVTVIGAANFSATERHINRNPVKFPLPGNNTIEQNSLHSIDPTNAVGSILPFEKKIGRNDYYITPGNLSSQEKFYESSIKEPVFRNRLLYFAEVESQPVNDQRTRDLSNSPFITIPPTPNSISGSHLDRDTIRIKELSANSLKCSVETTTPRFLISLQNAYPGWKVFIDGQETSVLQVNTSFMAAKIPAGKHEIIFSYHPALIIYAWYISLLTMIGTGLFFLRLIPGNRALENKRHQ